MNDSTFQSEANHQALFGDALPRDDSPQFGAIDIVEAFTAMRHEWRGQTKESLALAEQVHAAVSNIQLLESKLLACVAEPRSTDNGSDDAAASKPLVLMIVDTDHQLSRAIAAINQWEMNRKLRDEADTKAVDHYFAGMNGFARWWARPLLTFIADQRTARTQSTENPAIEGLNFVMTRIRRAMNEHGIERLDTEGQVFDAETMRAIDTIESDDCPSGHVAEQLSPAYRWQGRLLRFADVRVAK